MQSTTNDDLTYVHQQMVNAIQQAIPEIHHVAAYNPLVDKKVKTPGVLLEVVGMELDTPISGGRTAVKVEFAAHCILSVATQQVELEVRNFAVKVMQVINKNRWGLGALAQQPTALSAFPGSFKPDVKGFKTEEKGYESWVISWEQVFHLGDIWQGVEFTPDEILIKGTHHIESPFTEFEPRITNDGL
ncbi:hypothetical protein [Spartinivicinus poritis]|uniref:Uncharacterized protein n=1 Tax=Spartinivicinus poritis TaxID=2994640 RepID=A0ABT5UFM8_9GAMM|nr:hypothetical protein [Spartinivicinus sp. A2-2]MDE1464791.1 hypothetical protein [Spartinivicinus sp. A2-2]